MVDAVEGAGRSRGRRHKERLAMASYNRVILVGNLTRDPELRYLPAAWR